MQVTLYDSRTNGETRNIIAIIEADTGDLVIDGQDLGPSVEKFWGDSDYEYWLRVPKALKSALLASLLVGASFDGDLTQADAVLLALLVEKFNGADAFTQISQWCVDHGIEAQFSSYA